MCRMKPGDILKFIPKLLMKSEFCYMTSKNSEEGTDKFFIHFACLTVLNFIILFVTAISMLYEA